MSLVSRTFFFMIIPTFVVCVSTCGRSNYASNDNPLAARAKDSGIKGVCNETPSLVDTNGFEIPKLKESRQKTKNHVLSKRIDDAEILVSSFEPINGRMETFNVPQKLFGMSSKGWEVKHIIQYKTNEKVFQYVVTVSPSGVSAMIQFVYTDTDGNGSLDTVCQASDTPLPVIPSWLSKSQPASN